MTTRKKINLILFFGILIFISFYGYNISENKGSIEIKNEELTVDQKTSNLEKGIIRFSDVEYKSSDEKGRVYTTRGKEAYLNENQPDIVMLNNVFSFTRLKDGSQLSVKSDNANYYKNTKNIKYYKNITIKNKDVIITAEMADFEAKNNIIKLENKVILKDDKNTIKGDIAILNTITNDLQILMKKKDNKVYGQQQKK